MRSMRSILAVVNVLGSLLALFALYYLLPLATALIYGETAQLQAFAIPAGVTLGVGLVLLLATRRWRAELKPRDGYLLVSLSWLILTAAAAAPFMIGEPHLNAAHAYFEAMSGLSTTGSTVITGLDHLPHSMNLWRHALHWLGGMGIIVLAVAVLPLLGVGGMQMYRAETPGSVKDTKLTPRITETAKALWMVYASLTAVCTFALWSVGMSLFDAICHAFSVMALGGFSNYDASIGHFNSPAIEAVLMIFMLVATVNFSTHFIAFRRGDLDAYRRDPEARWVMLLLGISVVIVALVVGRNHLYGNWLTTLRHTAFTTISIATTTGFVTEDYSRWPLFASMWVLFLSCVTCSTGSTGSGIKMFRALVLVKQCFREMFLLVHPQAVQPLKVGGKVIASRVVYSVLAFIFIYFMTVVVLTFALLATDMDFMSAFTAVIASINNAGPGLGLVGPMANYGVLSDLQVWICTLGMFLGRIELFTFLLLFSRTFWRK
ncbi:MAG: potassium transporter TrkG [Steroidobacteraceae bacterium]